MLLWIQDHRAIFVNVVLSSIRKSQKYTAYHITISNLLTAAKKVFYLITNNENGVNYVMILNNCKLQNF